MGLLETVVSANPEAAIQIAQDGIPKILDFCLKTINVCKEPVPVVEHAFKTIRKAAISGKVSLENLASIMKLMDHFKDRKSVMDAGSAVLGKMISPAELKKCLEMLSSASDDSAQKNTALVALSSMSYISSYAEEVVKSGALHLICEVVWSKYDLSGSCNAQIQVLSCAINPAHASSFQGF